jgi:hypothetical protein
MSRVFFYKYASFNEEPKSFDIFRIKAIFHCSRFARAGGASFENLLTRA